MKTYKIILIIATILSAMYSCETEIDFDNKDVSPYIVVNSIINPDSLIKVQVSKSRFFLEKDGEFESIDNATVKLYVNNSYLETLKKTSTAGIYIGNYKAIVGDIVKLVVTSTEFGEASAETSIIKPITINKIDTSSTITYIYPIVNYMPSENVNDYGYTMDTVGMNYTYSLNLAVNIKDSADTKNYYRLKAKYRQYLDNGKIDIYDIYINSNDNVFGSTGEDEIFGNSNSSQYYHEFSDELFDGKNYKLQLNLNYNKSVYYNTSNNTDEHKPDIGYPTTIKQEIVVEIQSLSESYYLYLHSRGAQLNYVEFFSEPVQIQSNITNGIGILGSYTIKQSTIEVPLTWQIGQYFGNNNNEW